VSGAEVPKEGGLPTMQAAEAQERFSMEAEAQAFLAKVNEMDLAFDDAQGRHKLRIRVEVAVDKFALAMQKRSPFYSASDAASLNGDITMEMREVAKQYILPRLLARPSLHSVGLQMLQDFLTGQHTQQGRGGPEAGAGRSRAPDVHIERYPNDNWRR
jgi:hypothetical protein